MAIKIEKQGSKFIKPFVSTPSTLRRCKLGFIDEFIDPTDIPIVLFFTKNSNDNPKRIGCLEKSLEKTLTRFYPLAGKYVNGDNTIDCSDQGVEFIYAKVNTKLEGLLASEVLVKLIDEFVPSRVEGSLLATQVTSFECGGVAIGVNASHKIVDAPTLSIFINEWAVMNREKNEDELKVDVAFNSSSLFPGRGLCSFETLYMSNDDILNKFTRKKLSFSESLIANMKVKVMSKTNTHRLSKVQLVSSVVWKALVGVDRAIYNYPRDSMLFLSINLRDKMASLIPKDSCGNLVGVCGTESTTLETTEELLQVLRDAIDKTISNLSKVDDLHSEQVQTMVLNSFKCLDNITESTNVIWLTSWCKLPFYEADFGFGKPTWVAPGLTPLKNSVFLMDDAQGNGVEVYVFLENKDVPYFEQALTSDAEIYGFSCV